jgi:hypothetical protein
MERVAAPTVRFSTIAPVVHTSLSPERVLFAARDFSDRRSKVFSAVQKKYFVVHELGPTFADVTEGTRAGPIVNWERSRYDWSKPGSVIATVIDTNIYAIPGSSWELRATPEGGGSRVEMIWIRGFNRRPKGRFFGWIFPRFGEKLLAKYAREIIDNLEKLESTDS